jgi:zinc transporter 9
MGIFFVGFGFTVYHGIAQFMSAQPWDPVTESWIPIAILGMSFIIESYTFWVALGAVNHARGEMDLLEFIRRGDDPTAVAVLLEDAIAVIGVVIAFLGLYLSKTLDSPYPDAIASIVIGVLLGVMAVVLAIANGRILMGVAAGADVEAEIREFIESYPSVEKVTSMKTAVMAPGALRLALEIEFHGGILINKQQVERDAERIRDGEDPAYILVETAERMVRVVGREINKLESDIFAEFPQVQSIDLEVN